jgi:glycosyltransferase involved in cell wall biosynthesis
MSPKISVIISTYNGAQYIGETIESVRSQTWQNWELIIVDDGSDDNTCEVISGIRDERIHLYEAGRIGVNGRIKNIALSKVSGDLIAFIDHDDLWHPEKLEKQVAALKEYPEAGFCFTGGYNFKTNGEAVEYFYKQKEGVRFNNVFLSIFRSEVTVWTQALLMRRECLEVTGPFSETGIFADPEFVIRLTYHFKAILLYEPLMYHRLHEANYTIVNWETSHQEGLDVIRSYKNKKMLPAHLAREVLFKSHIRFGENCLKRKKRVKAINSFFKAWVQRPFSIIPFKKTAKAVLYYLKGK